MKYRAKYAIMGNAVTDINSVARSLDGYAQRLVKVRNTMNSFGEMQSIQSSIASRVTAVSDAADIAKSSAVCLDNIRVAYITAEKNAHLKLSKRFSFKGSVIAGVGRVTVPGTTGGNLPRISWRDLIRRRGTGAGAPVALKLWPAINWKAFKEWFDRIRPGGNRPRPGTITRDQQKAADRRMQAEIRELQRNAVNRFNNARTDEERMKILTDFLAGVQKTMGTSANAEIDFRPMRYDSKGIALGSYNHNRRTIALNQTLLSKPEALMLFETVVHEARHAYQFEAAFGNKHTVSPETRAEWKHNLSPGNYISPSTCFTSYKNQPVERDAREFSRGRA